MIYPKIASVVLPLNELRLGQEGDSFKRKSKYGINIDGQDFTASSRFTDSMLGVIRQSGSVFNLFSPKEVVTRFMERNVKNTSVRFTYEVDSGVALAVTNPNKPLVSTGILQNILDPMIDSGRVRRATYADGVFTADCVPQNEIPGFNISKDVFNYQYMTNVPIDGYGAPNIFMMMYRLVCTNGMVAMAPSYRQPIALGKDDTGYGMGRSFESFSNLEGWEILRGRLELSAKVPASMAEYEATWTCIHQAIKAEFSTDTDEKGVPILSVEGRQMLWGIYHSFSQLGGDIMAHYSIASLKAIPKRDKMSAPVSLSIYDLLNMLSEVSTHYISTPTAIRCIGGQVGALMASQVTWDMEGVHSGMDVTSRNQERYFHGVANRRQALLNSNGTPMAFQTNAKTSVFGVEELGEVAELEDAFVGVGDN